MNIKANSPVVVLIPIGSPSSDLTVPAGYFAHAIKIVSCRLMNGAALAASDTNYVQLSLKKGTDVLAELDTRAAHEGALEANVGKAMNLATAAGVDVAAGSSLSLVFDETDAGTNVALTNALVAVEYYPL